VPVVGAMLPDIERLLPGSPRPYRYGVHEGLDFYGGIAGIAIPKGAPVVAAQTGLVIRADWNYTPPTAEQMAGWLHTAATQHYTPPDILDRLRGRQVWIDHGNGVVSRYVHLDEIAPGIVVGRQVKAGEQIAFVGNSGTPESLVNPEDDLHLHFELRIGDGYLGQFLTPVETRRWLGRLFAP